MTYNFRIRFNLPARLSLASKDDNIVISSSDDEHEIILSSAETDKDFAAARKLSITGKYYATEEDAKVAAEEWQSFAEVGFAYMGLAADFGGRAPRGFFTRAGLKMLEERQGSRVLNDVHGIMTYESEPKPLLVSTGADVVVGIPLKETREVILEASRKRVTTTSDEHVAYELYAASFFLENPDARLLTLMMAVETLVERKKRQNSVVDLVSQLINDVNGSNLNRLDKDSIISALRDQRLQSINQACRALASSLDPMLYNELSASEFMNECYKIRSGLVHGSNPRPSREEVGKHAAALERMVGHLLSKKLGRAFR